MCSVKKCNKLIFLCIAGLPVFFFAFFVIYWFVVCPVIWKNYYNHDVRLVGFTSWSYIWLGSYWLVVVAIWVLIFVIYHFRCNKSEEEDAEEIEMDFTRTYGKDRRRDTESPETYIPFTSYLETIQPQKASRQNSGFNNEAFHNSEVEVFATAVQPPMSSLPGSGTSREKSTKPLDGCSSPDSGRFPEDVPNTPATANGEPEWEDEVPWLKNTKKRIYSSESDMERTMEPLEDFSNYLHLVPQEEPSLKPSKHRVVK